MKKVSKEQARTPKQMSFMIFGMLKDAVEGRLPQPRMCDNRILKACLGRGYFRLVGPKTVHPTPFGYDEYDRMRLAHASLRNKSGPLSASVLAFASWELRQIHEVRKRA